MAAQPTFPRQRCGDDQGGTSVDWSFNVPDYLIHHYERRRTVKDPPSPPQSCTGNAPLSVDVTCGRKRTSSCRTFSLAPTTKTGNLAARRADENATAAAAPPQSQEQNLAFLSCFLIFLGFDQLSASIQRITSCELLSIRSCCSTAAPTIRPRRIPRSINCQFKRTERQTKVFLTTKNEAIAVVMANFNWVSRMLGWDRHPRHHHDFHSDWIRDDRRRRTYPF